MAGAFGYAYFRLEAESVALAKCEETVEAHQAAAPKCFIGVKTECAITECHTFKKGSDFQL
jgi:hypothetical protein